LGSNYKGCNENKNYIQNEKKNLNENDVLKTNALTASIPRSYWITQSLGHYLPAVAKRQSLSLTRFYFKNVRPKSSSSPSKPILPAVSVCSGAIKVADTKE